MNAMKLLPATVLLAALAGCATQPVPPVDTAEAQAAQVGTCLRETGTRIKLPPGQCVAAPGRSYEREDLRRTGAVSLSEALWRLGAF
ncbi:MAG: hypothetical protein ACRES8_04100 [Nevskiaceae bacterium]